MQAIKRVGTAADIVGTVAFLTSDDSSFVTGQTIVADGGLMRSDHRREQVASQQVSWPSRAPLASALT